MSIDFGRCPPKPAFVTKERYEDLCHLFASCNYDFQEFEKTTAKLNAHPAAINACGTCMKVDIDPLSHWRECDVNRIDQQDWLWKD